MSETHRGGAKTCKVCAHPGRQEIDAALLSQAKYAAIISKMRATYPGAPELNASNLSRHYKNHLITKPIKTTEVDPETGEVKEGFIVGHLTPHIAIPREAIPPPEARVTIPDALAVIIQAGVRNAITNPETVTMKDVLAAIEIARKLGLRGDDENEFRDAWQALGEAKKGNLKRKTQRRRRVTVEDEETVEERDDRNTEGDFIEGEVIAPEEGWSDEEMGLLPEGDN